MHLERAGERFYGRKQPLLQGAEDEAGGVPGRLRGLLEAGLAQGSVLVEHTRQLELRGVVGKVRDLLLDDRALREFLADLAQVVLEPADEDGVVLLGRDRNAAAEALGVEDLEQCGEAVAVAVVRRGGEEQAVLETRGDVAHHAGEVRIDGVPGPTGGRRVMGLVEDQQRAGAEAFQPGAERTGVCFVVEEGMGEQEAGVGVPRIDRPAPLAAHGGDVRPVEDLKGQAEALLELLAPLEEDGGRTADHDAADFLTDEQLADDQAGFDGLAEADVVGDEEVDARKLEGLAQGLELVGEDLDAGAVGRLKQLGVRRGDAVPAQRVEIGGEAARVVEAARGDRAPRVSVEDLSVELAFPEDDEGRALRVVVEAGEPDERLLCRSGGGFDALDQVLAGANANDLAGGGEGRGGDRVGHRRFAQHM